MLSPRNRQSVRDRLKDMPQPVKLIYFTQEMECPVCAHTRTLLRELTEASDRLSLEVYDFQHDLPAVAQYGIDKIPATVVEGARDFGIRFYGLPAGYILGELLETIVTVSGGLSGLTPRSVAALRELDRPVHLEVFVTPT